MVEYAFILVLICARRHSHADNDGESAPEHVLGYNVHTPQSGGALAAEALDARSALVVGIPPDGCHRGARLLLLAFAPSQRCTGPEFYFSGAVGLWDTADCLMRATTVTATVATAT